MNRIPAALLVSALSLATASAAYAQTTAAYPNGGYATPVPASQTVDYGTVVRVDQVPGGYTTTTPAQGQRCYTERGTGGYVRNDPYSNNPYRNDPYRNDPYRNNGYVGNDGYGDNVQYGTDTGRTVATILGTVVGAALGSKVGGGGARYMTGAVGSAVGGMAGRQIYESTMRQRAQRAGVTVCDPVAEGSSYPTNVQSPLYDVTYDYNGRRYSTRTQNYYRVGDRIRVVVDVRPD